MKLTEGWAHFRTEGGVIFSCRTFAEAYPGLSSIFKKATEKAELVFPTEMFNILEKAKVFAQHLEKAHQTVEITIKDNLLKVESGGDYGWFIEKVKIDYNKEAILFSVSPTFFQSILTYTQNCNVEQDKLMFRGVDWVHVICTMV